MVHLNFIIELISWITSSIFSSKNKSHNSPNMLKRQFLKQFKLHNFDKQINKILSFG
jgi:hypothetical protein